MFAICVNYLFKHDFNTQLWCVLFNKLMVYIVNYEVLFNTAVAVFDDFRISISTADDNKLRKPRVYIRYQLPKLKLGTNICDSPANVKRVHWFVQYELSTSVKYYIANYVERLWYG